MNKVHLMGHRKLLFARLLVFRVCNWMNSHIAQKITCTTAIPDKKVIYVFCVSGADQPLYLN